MSNVIPFEFDQQPVRVVQGDDGDSLFVAADVAKALGYAKPENAIARHCKRATTTPKQGGGFYSVIRESDVYRLIVKSQLPSAERFEAWVFEEVLPTIRKTGGYQAGQPAESEVDQSRLRGELALAECFCSLTNVSESGKVTILHQIGRAHGMNTGFLPGYVADGPAGVEGQSLPTASATELLREWRLGLRAADFNQVMADHGYLERKTRRSSKGVKGYWAVTDKGLDYGKNITSPQNPRETQPHWYVDRFEQLLVAMGLLDSKGLAS